MTSRFFFYKEALSSHVHVALSTRITRGRGEQIARNSKSRTRANLVSRPTVTHGDRARTGRARGDGDDTRGDLRARRTSGPRDVFRRASPVSVRGSHRRVERKRFIDATSLRKCRDVGGRDRRGFGSLRAFAVHLRRDSEGGPPEERRDTVADARGGLAAPGVLHAHQHALGSGVEHA